ncbi:dihydrolipoyl dehydrogenase [Oscillospiraceae bacterium PP1C4]
MEIKMSIIPGGKLGKVGKISVKQGEFVKTGDVLAQVETSKGNRQIKATVDGIVQVVLFEEGADVKSDAVMFEIAQDSVQEETKTDSAPTEFQEIDTDLLVIGGGPGGYVAAIYAAKHGLKVTLAEKAELGGTCLNVGCIPTKALVKSSEICHNVHEGAHFGINCEGNINVDMARVIKRKDEVRTRLVDGVDFLMKKNNINVVKGKASFVSATEVQIEGETNYRIRAKDTIIATGSKISNINIPGINLPFVMNSTSALSCEQLPKSITIIGGGVIGMEFAFIYKNFGADVHVIEFMDRLLTMVDPDISQEILDIAAVAGIDVNTSSKVVKIQASTDGNAVVTYENKDGEHLVVSEKVLVAIGREPNLDGLMIDKTNAELNERGRGIKVDTRMRTNVDHLYAIGDVTNIIQLAHVASHQGIVAVENILGKNSEMDYSAVPNVIFTAPEIASVGKNESDCKAAGIDYAVSRFDFAGNGKALTMSEPRGYIKLIKDHATKKIIGGSIIGADASALISALTLAIENGFGEEEITKTIFAHPTTGEVIHEAAMGFGVGALHQ